MWHWSLYSFCFIFFSSLSLLLWSIDAIVAARRSIWRFPNSHRQFFGISPLLYSSNDVWRISHPRHSHSFARVHVYMYTYISVSVDIYICTHIGSSTVRFADPSSIIVEKFFYFSFLFVPTVWSPFAHQTMQLPLLLKFTVLVYRHIWYILFFLS